MDSSQAWARRLWLGALKTTHLVARQTQISRLRRAVRLLCGLAEGRGCWVSSSAAPSPPPSPQQGPCSLVTPCLLHSCCHLNPGCPCFLLWLESNSVFRISPEAASSRKLLRTHPPTHQVNQSHYSYKNNIVIKTIKCHCLLILYVFILGYF